MEGLLKSLIGQTITNVTVAEYLAVEKAADPYDLHKGKNAAVSPIYISFASGLTVRIECVLWDYRDESGILVEKVK